MQTMPGDATEPSTVSGGFSRSGYEGIIAGLLAAGYGLCGVDALADPAFTAPEPRVFVRHDVDCDLAAATEMARWDAELDVRSTFFVAVQSPFYDITAPGSCSLIKTILALGHEVCLHLDVRDPVSGIARYAALHRVVPNIRTDFATIHSPQPAAEATLQSLGLVDALVSLNTAGFSYVSDAQGSWRYGHPLEVEAFAGRGAVHLNTHPEWWVAGAATPLTLLADHDPQVRRAAAQWFPKLARRCPAR